MTEDGNFKANLFYKRDDGSDKALTDGRMYFPPQNEYDRIAREYVVPDEDKVRELRLYYYGPKSLTTNDRRYLVRHTLDLFGTRGR